MYTDNIMLWWTVLSAVLSSALALEINYNVGGKLGPPKDENGNFKKSDFCRQNLWGRPNVSGSAEDCAQRKQRHASMLMNVPQFGGVYCFNDHTGNCKGFSGRFELQFNTFKDDIIGPVPKSEYVDEFGYHERVPVTYNVKGTIIYADRSINWARNFKTQIGNRSVNLLNLTQFNWCLYTENDMWPYKSAIKHINKQGKEFHIYFFNRQSCIYDTSKNHDQRQHFNTRFLHNSQLRIDLDINPTIFAMEDALTNPPNQIRLVKHHRQHWFEVPFEVLENPTKDVRYFVDMANIYQRPCKIHNESGALLPVKSYRKYSQRCVSDFPMLRTDHEIKDYINAAPITTRCGADYIEIIDKPKVEVDQGYPNVQKVFLHGIPRIFWGTGHPSSTVLFYKVTNLDDKDWETFARDGWTFSASTTIPVAQKDSVRVLMLYASFKASIQQGPYDDHFPLPYIADYIARFNADAYEWYFDRENSPRTRSFKELNYVDDIAYLYKCQTVLIIFGPLYSELPADQFSPNTTAYIDSIYQLGLFELAHAFYNEPEKDPSKSDTLYVLHRVNWVQALTYTCGQNGGLVTAQKKGRYFPVYGQSERPELREWDQPYNIHDTDYSEEYFWELLNIFKGDRLANREAPDPNKYPFPAGPPESAKEEEKPWWIWLVLAIGIVIVIAMIILFLLALRRIGKHGRKGGGGFGGLSIWPFPTKRSSGLSGKHPSDEPSVRSRSLKRSSMLAPTARSALKLSKGLPRPSSHPSTRTRRTSRSSSRSSGSSGSSGSTGSSPSSRKTTRSALSKKLSKLHSSKHSSKHLFKHPSKQPSGSAHSGSRPKFVHGGKASLSHSKN